MKIKLFILFVLLFSNQMFAKIRFLTFHYNRPDLIELQVRTLEKFVGEDYELIVFNDARLPEVEEEIRVICEGYGVQCVRFQPEWHETSRLNDEFIRMLNDPDLIHSHIWFQGVKDVKVLAGHGSLRHARVIQYAMDNFGYNHDDIVVLLDGDAFAIRPLELRKYIRAYDIVASLRELDPDYLWVPFIAMNIKKLPNKQDLQFHPSIINNYMYDTGAQTYHYLKQNPKVRVKKILNQSSQCFLAMNDDEMKGYGFNDKEIELTRSLPKELTVEFHFEHRILHFIASSFGSLGQESVDIKTKCIREFIEKILTD